VITLYFVRTWLKWLAGCGLTVLGERVLLGMTWRFILIGLLTVLLFALLTWLMYGDWRVTRRNGTGYRYDIIRDVTRR
jgi:hypothetical protein